MFVCLFIVCVLGLKNKLYSSRTASWTVSASELELKTVSCPTPAKHLSMAPQCPRVQSLSPCSSGTRVHSVDHYPLLKLQFPSLHSCHRVSRSPNSNAASFTARVPTDLPPDMSPGCLTSSPKSAPFCLFSFGTGSHYVTKAGLEPGMFLPGLKGVQVPVSRTLLIEVARACNRSS